MISRRIVESADQRTRKDQRDIERATREDITSAVRNGQTEELLAKRRLLCFDKHGVRGGRRRSGFAGLYQYFSFSGTALRVMGG